MVFVITMVSAFYLLHCLGDRIEVLVPAEGKVEHHRVGGLLKQRVLPGFQPGRRGCNLPAGGALEVVQSHSVIGPGIGTVKHKQLLKTT